MSFAQARTADAALAVLLCPTPRLQKLVLNWAGETTVHLVSAFTSLIVCEIWQPEDALDMASFSSLTNLQELSLAYGTFSNLHPPDHLLWLRISQATATICEDYDGHSSLLELHISDCELDMPGPSGLCACTQLQILECGDRTVVTAPNAANSLSLVAPTHIPAGAFNLSGLTALSLVFDCSQAGGGNFDTVWLYSLVHLQHLALHVYVDSDNGGGLCMAFDEKLTRLNNLQSLMAAADADCAILFCPPWHLMTALQSVHCQCSVGITNISDLLPASRLRTIKYASGLEEENSGNVRYAPEAFVQPWRKLEQYIQLHCPTFDCQFEFETTSSSTVESTSF